MRAGEKEQYLVDIGMRGAPYIQSILCKEGVDSIFKAITDNEKFIIYYCCKGDKTLLRIDDICWIYSKKVGGK